MKNPMLRSSLFAAIMLTFTGTVSAAGLGRINVFSALGQPLRAEVEIAAGPEELDTMVAKLASPDAFQRANIEYVGALATVKMSIEKRTGHTAVVKIATDKPFSEPFVDMLVELNWAGGRLLREYTFLLDPAESSGSKSVTAVAQPAVVPFGERRRETARREVSRAQAATVAVDSAARDGEYLVKPGDTLYRIASELKTVEISQDQLIAALYRANASAFIGGDINRLRTGRILKVPQADEARQIAPGEARKIIVRASNFEKYRQTVASAAAAGSAKVSEAGQSAAGKIAPRVEEQDSGLQQGKDRVKITGTQVVRAAEEPSGGMSSTVATQVLQDELASQARALKEANAKVADLERNIKELQKLVELKSQGLAEAQKQAVAVGAATKETGSRTDGQGSTKADVAAAASAAGVLAPAASPVVADSPRPIEPVQPVATVSQPEALASVPAEAAQSQVRSAPSQSAQALPSQTEEGQAGVLGDPLTWLGTAAAALGAGYLVIKRRRRSEAAATSPATDGSTTTPSSVFGSTGGQTVDTGGTSLLHTDFSQSGFSAIDSDEGVDPVAEADVYMAYGRDAQAEEILLDALKSDPGRPAVYVKLLEIYAQRRSVKQFENIAADLYTQTGGRGDDWEKAAALGARLDPENPLYRSLSAEGVTIPKAEVASAIAAAAVPAAIGVSAQQAGDVGDSKAVKFGTNQVSQMRSTWTVPGEIAQFAASGEVRDVPSPVETPTPTPEALNLDFNLDLELNEGEESHTQVSEREMSESAELAPLVETVVEQSAMPRNLVDDLPGDQGDALPLEFDLGLNDDLENKPAPAAPQMVSTQLEPLSQLSTQMLGSFVGDEDADVEIKPTMRESLAVVDLEKTNFEGTLLDFDFELGDEVSKPALDLSDLNLAPAAKAAEGGEPALAEPTPTSNQESAEAEGEIATKLELAGAYEEMGDMEGARELLEEVMAGGTSQQQAAARAILSRID